MAFEKLDGSNLRFEWQKKSGWCKSGTRERLFDETDDMFAPALKIFKDKYAEPLEAIFRNNKLLRKSDRITAFCEFFGPSSFAGIHKQNEPKDVVLFDIHVRGSGMVGPSRFVDFFGELHIPKVVYEGNLNTSFIEGVRNGHYDVVEGVICKSKTPWTLWMTKVKTLSYLAHLKEVYADGWEKFWE